MDVLVTGGAGFVGSHLVDALLERGDRVAVVDDLSTGSRANLAGALARGATLVELDVRDAAALRQVMARLRPEVVFHLAAQVSVQRSIADPTFDASVNVLGTIAVLEAARACGVARLVHTSTGGGIYGSVEQVPTPETVAPRPLSPYGESKLCAEEYVGWSHRVHGTAATTLRYGNVYGPRQRAGAEGGVVAILCACAREGRAPTIFGDGRQTRDYVHVGDVVAANLCAAQHRAAPGFTFNIGTGRESSLLELLAAVGHAAGREPWDVVHAPARPGEVRRSALDAGLAARVLGQRCTTALREGIRQTWAAGAPLLVGTD